MERLRERGGPRALGGGASCASCGSMRSRTGRAGSASGSRPAVSRSREAGRPVMDVRSVGEVRRVSRTTGVERSVRAVPVVRGRAEPERQRERTAWIGRVVDPSLLRREPGARRDAGRRDRERERVRRRTQAERMREVLELLAKLRVVSYRSVVDAAFDGHPHTARRGIGALEQQGLIERRSVKPIGSKRNGDAESFQVLALTAKGAGVCERNRREAGEAGRPGLVGLRAAARARARRGGLGPRPLGAGAGGGVRRRGARRAHGGGAEGRPGPGGGSGRRGTGVPVGRRGSARRRRWGCRRWMARSTCRTRWWR